MPGLGYRVRGREAWEMEATGPAKLAEVMEAEELRVAGREMAHLQPLPTGFQPLDEVLSGGLRPGELLIIGGPAGVGKTIWGLQTARNAVSSDPDCVAVYVCYEHDRSHLLSRLICLESAERGAGDYALTMRNLASLAFDGQDGVGLISRLRRAGPYASVIQAIEGYSERLVLVHASGAHSTLDQIEAWTKEVVATAPKRVLLVVDYLQKIPISWHALQPESEATTFLAQGLKELAMSLGIRVIAIVASDRMGLKAKRMRLSDIRGSSAVQYEADIGLILSNKYDIISREHLVYHLGQAEAMRHWVVMSVEKNRAGRSAIDMEYPLDAMHFRIVPKGNFVRERLVDDKLILA